MLAVVGAFGNTATAQIKSASLAADVRDFVAFDAAVLVLRGIRLIDGTGGPARENQTVVIRDGLIEAVGATEHIAVPDGAMVLDLPAHTAFPGIVGMHDHLGFGWDFDTRQDARLYLGAGVTTIRTTGTYEPYRDINLKRQIDEGRLPGPRLHLSSPYITGQGPQLRMAQVSTPEEARRFVDHWADEGIRWIKIYTRMARRELAAVIQQAHARGIRVTGHLCAVTAREAAELGIDNIEHGPTSSDFDPAKPRDVCPRGVYPFDPESEAVREALHVLVQRGVAITATLPEVEAYEPMRPAADPRVFDFLTPRTTSAYHDQRAGFDSAAPGGLARAQALLRSFVDAGGLLVAGTDPVFPALLAGFADQRNYELLVEAGFAPVQAIRIMTLNGATLLGVDSLIGTIAPGKVADLVVVRGNPIAVPAAIREVAWVVKDGIVFDSQKLLASVRREITSRE